MPVFRSVSTTVVCRKQISDPVHPNDLHRAGGIASFMRVPIVEPPKLEGDLDVAFLGIPLDTATSNRPGARYLAKCTLRTKIQQTALHFNPKAVHLFKNGIFFQS